MLNWIINNIIHIHIDISTMIKDFIKKYTPGFSDIESPTPVSIHQVTGILISDQHESKVGMYNNLKES